MEERDKSKLFIAQLDMLFPFPDQVLVNQKKYYASLW